MAQPTFHEIHAAIPHRAPFLFVDEIVERGDCVIICRHTFTPDQPFFSGHYPSFPLVPGVLLCEAALQAGAILLARHAASSEKRVPVVTRINNVRFKRIVRPGETIEMRAELVERLKDAYVMGAKVTSGGALAVRLEFICALAPVGEG